MLLWALVTTAPWHRQRAGGGCTHSDGGSAGWAAIRNRWEVLRRITPPGHVGGVVLVSVCFVLLRSILEFLARSGRSKEFKELERHQWRRSSHLALRRIAGAGLA